MGVPAGELPGAAARDVEHRAAVVSRPAGRRRPSGQPPPLPRPLRATGVGWLVAAAALVSALVVVFAGGLRGAAVTVTVVDDTIVRWLAGSHLPGVHAVFGALGSWAAISILLWGLLVTLVILRRLRHLVVVLVVWTVQGVIIQYVLGPLLRPATARSAVSSVVAQAQGIGRFPGRRHDRRAVRDRIGRVIEFEHGPARRPMREPTRRRAGRLQEPQRAVAPRRSCGLAQQV
jgi:hypothetical protein